MKTLHDYESMGWLNMNQHKPRLWETFSGTEIVKWHGRIGDQLVGLLDDATKGRNFPYADKIREFLRIWRDNSITGSINRETLDTLTSAADILAVDNWNLRSYFSSLATQLKVLIASEEELPRDMDMTQNEPMAGGAGAGRGAPPMSPSFGPQGEPPGGEAGAGAAGEEGMPPPEGAPGAEGGAPAPGEEMGPPGAEGAPPGEEGAGEGEAARRRPPVR